MDIFATGTAPDDECFERDFKIALVYSGDMEDHKFMETVVVNRGYNLSVFPEIDEAILWLTMEAATT